MDRLKSIFGSAGFYAVLALCVLAVGVGGSFALFAGREIGRASCRERV